MNDPMTILKRDHREVKAMLKELSESRPGRARATLLRQVERDLTLHMEIEEGLLYPLVRREEGDEVDEEARNEHALARDALSKATDMVSTPGFGAAVAALLGGIEHHVKEEESEILPKLKRELDRDQWRELGDRIAAAKERGAKKSRSRSKAAA